MVTADELGRSAQWGGWFADRLEDVPLRLVHRPAGEAVLRFVQPGDHIVVAEPLASLRTHGAARRTLAGLLERRVVLHVLAGPVPVVDTAERAEQLLEWLNSRYHELRLASANIAQQAKRQSGLPAGGHRAPLGWRRVGKKAKARYVVDAPERQQALYIVQLRDRDGLSREAIYFKLLRCLRRRDGREWSMGAIQRAYAAAKAGFPLRGCVNETDRIPQFALQ